MARLCQPPYEFVSLASLEHDIRPSAKPKMTIFLLMRKEKAPVASRIMAMSTGPVAVVLPGAKGWGTGLPNMTIQVSDAEKDSVLEIFSGMSTTARQKFAVDDILAGLRLWRLAWALGWLDIRLRYRGSMLGPFWLTISTGVMVGSLGFLYAALWHISVRDYLPFLALSQVLWGFLATLVSESCVAFTESEGVIRSMRMPYFVFAMRVLVRNVLVLGHNILVIVVVFLLFLMWPGPAGLMAIPALPLWLIDALALALLLGGICARFRDIMPIVNSVMMIAFFLSPVIWKPEQLKEHAVWLPFNPFYDMLEIVRAPLLGEIPSLLVWVGALGYSAMLCGLAWAFFLRARGRISFWM
jgi:lipopolysaccharide transport system permease protein